MPRLLVLVLLTQPLRKVSARWDVFALPLAGVPYVLGPVLGAIIGINLYGLLFAGDEVVEDYADPVLEAPAAVAATAPLKVVKSQLQKTAAKSVC